MNELKRIDEKLNERNVKVNGALVYDYVNDNYIKLYDMNYTTFRKTFIGAYVVDADKLMIM